MSTDAVPSLPPGARTGSPGGRQVVFVLGVHERSGTNYLWDLLRVHPHSGWRPRVYEDNLLRHAGLLARYVDAVADSWDPRWGVRPDERSHLLRCLGSGLQEFLRHDAVPEWGTKVVVKTPGVDNLPLFFELFPDSPLVVLVRDGRSVTESGVRSFGWSYPVTMRRWARGAGTIVAATAAFAAAARPYLLVRYEDLLADLEGQLRPVLAFCGLDPDAYDYERVARMPLRGSSSVREGADAPVSWRALPRPADFDAAERHRDWPPVLHHLFAELAGEVSARLGYPLGPLPALSGRERVRLAGYRAELALSEGRRTARSLRAAAARARATH